MTSHKQRLLRRCHPPPAQRASHNFHYVIMAQHAQCIWCGACVGMLRACARLRGLHRNTVETVGAPRGKFGRPSHLRMASLKSPSGSTRHLAVGSVSSQAEAPCPAMLLSRAFAIRPPDVLLSRQARSAS
jgi:hypothetical protein